MRSHLGEPAMRARPCGPRQTRPQRGRASPRSEQPSRLVKDRIGVHQTASYSASRVMGRPSRPVPPAGASVIVWDRSIHEVGGEGGPATRSILPSRRFIGREGARNELLVIEVDGVAVGYALTRSHQRHGHPGWFEIGILGISKESQGRHLGVEAMRAVVDRVRAREATALVIGRFNSPNRRMRIRMSGGVGGE